MSRKKSNKSIDLGAGNGDLGINEDNIRTVRLSPQEDEELEALLRDYTINGNSGENILLESYGVENTKDQTPTNQITYMDEWASIYWIFVFVIVIGIIIDLILLYDLKGRDRNGKFIDTETKNMAAVNGIGLALILTIIFVGGIYLLRREYTTMKTGTVLIVLIFITFLIIFLMGLFVGEYVNVGHVWSPVINLQPSD